MGKNALMQAKYRKLICVGPKYWTIEDQKTIPWQHSDGWSEFGINRKTLIHPALYQQLSMLLGGAMVWGIFSWLLSTN